MPNGEGNFDHRKVIPDIASHETVTKLLSVGQQKFRYFATSTAEADMNHLVEATQEVIHFRGLFQVLGDQIQKPEIFVDDQACVK